MNYTQVRKLNKDIKEFIIDLELHIKDSISFRIFSHYKNDNPKQFQKDTEAIKSFLSCGTYLNNVIEKYNEEE